ncbi:hypothetical protein PoB_001084700 [Plakobranchus ocellatus]|uniref:Uncharacterized protein n=1 Tax=Plakobranchus ocellatus TaxID=259542 RepID=A0AAV3YPI5_9GAST|nr:hypothetical protein PoB_001084700 [Plakobranchus ocellatus]
MRSSLLPAPYRSPANSILGATPAAVEGILNRKRTRLPVEERLAAGFRLGSSFNWGIDPAEDRKKKSKEDPMKQMFEDEALDTEHEPSINGLILGATPAAAEGVQSRKGYRAMHAITQIRESRGQSLEETQYMIEESIYNRMVDKERKAMYGPMQFLKRGSKEGETKSSSKLDMTIWKPKDCVLRYATLYPMPQNMNEKKETEKMEILFSPKSVSELCFLVSLVWGVRIRFC